MGRRVVLGFALAPAVTPLIVIGFALVGDVGLRESILVGSIYAGFTYGAALIFGIPAYLLLSRMGWRRLWQYAIAGAAIGAAILLGFFAFDRQPSYHPFIVVIFLGVGVLSTSVFWAIIMSE